MSRVALVDVLTCLSSILKTNCKYMCKESLRQRFEDQGFEFQGYKALTKPDCEVLLPDYRAIFCSISNLP